MFDEELRVALAKSLECLTENDPELLINGLYEPCVSHRLGLYMQHLFEDYNVDCEYNKVLVKTSEDNKKWHEKTFDKKRMTKHLEDLSRVFSDLDATKHFKLFERRRLKLSSYFDTAIETLAQLKSAEKLARPDIIVHERGTDKRNKLVIEIKLGGGDRCRVPMDLAKLVEFTVSPIFHYEYGLFLSFEKTAPFTKVSIGFANGAVFLLDPNSLEPLSGEPIFKC